MAGKIEKLKELANTMESDAASFNNKATDLSNTASNINNAADKLRKGIGILEYWNPNDNSIRKKERQEVLVLEKRISHTYKKYLLLWCIIVLITIIACIKFI